MKENFPRPQLIENESYTMVAANNEHSSSQQGAFKISCCLLLPVAMPSKNHEGGHIVPQELQRIRSDSCHIQVVEQALICRLIGLTKYIPITEKVL